MGRGLLSKMVMGCGWASSSATWWTSPTFVAASRRKSGGDRSLPPEGGSYQSSIDQTLRRISLSITLLFAAFASVHTYAVRHDSPWLRLVWVKGRYEPRPIVERWNPFSRIRVIGDPTREIKPSGWGFSATLPPSLRARELHLDIDSYAGTELTAFDGNPGTVEHLKYDVTNVVHSLRPSSDVVVVGTGGGRDILSALVFDQRHVTGVEINPSILELVNGRFGNFKVVLSLRGVGLTELPAWVADTVGVAA